MAAAHQMVSRPMKFAKGSFELLFAGEEAQSLVGDTLEPDNEESTNQQKRRRRKSTKGSNEPSAGQSKSAIRSECSATPDQENQ